MNISHIQEYMSNMKQIQEDLLYYLENEESNEVDFDELKTSIKDKKIQQNKQLLIGTLRLLSRISENHHRNKGFIDKIEQILRFFCNKKKKFLSKSEIFNIFKNNKRILLFLFEEKIIIPNRYIYEIISKDKYKAQFYPEYFFNEFKSNYDYGLMLKVNSTIPEGDKNDLELFNQKRKIGENPFNLCEMIRNDLIDDFVIFINKKNINLSKTTIKPSIYETNPYLLKKEVTLIEYAAFFGSIQIFNFLRLNNVELKSPLWLYAIHGHNPDMIHLLEENEVESPAYSFIKCYKESIKCHHIDLMDYIKNNFYRNDRDKNISLFLISLQYYNFNHFAETITRNIEYSYRYYNSDSEMSVKDEFIFFYNICKYGYIHLIDFFTDCRKVNINMTKIL